MSDFPPAPLVYVIILNWNSWRDTIECIDTIQHLAYPNYRVLVVDNASSDGSEQHIRNAYPQIEFIQTGANLGYAGGNNAGIRYALRQGATYILLVNPDVVLTSNVLNALVTACQERPDIGAVSPIIYYKDHPQCIYFSRGDIDWHDARVLQRNETPPELAVYPSKWVTGCSILLRAEALKASGLLDPQYFLYFEETDLCYRIAHAGYSVEVSSTARVLHTPGNAIGFGSPRQAYYLARNSLLFFSRHAANERMASFQLTWKLYRRHVLNRESLLLLLRRDPLSVAKMLGCLDFARGHFGPSKWY